MQIPTDAQSVVFKEWTMRVRPAADAVKRLFLLLHGWKGDETSMWIFASKLPGQYTLLAPRAPFGEPTGGYSWRKIVPGTRGYPCIDDLRPSAEALLQLVDDWSAAAGLDAAQFDLAGFSQGAALGYTLALLHPKRIGKLAALSGILPTGSDEYLNKRVLEQKYIFIAHGRQDELIPVSHGRQAATALEASGAKVTYCETDSKHKVSQECLNGMGVFFNG